MHGKVGHKGECRRCSRCCSYFCLEVDAPTSKREWDDYAWIVAHKGATLHVLGRTWQLVVHNRCEHLGAKGRCMIYDSRPAICRKHMPGECERDQDHAHDYDDTDRVIKSIEELCAYRKELVKRRRSRAAKRAAARRRRAAGRN